MLEDIHDVEELELVADLERLSRILKAWEDRLLLLESEVERAVAEAGRAAQAEAQANAAAWAAIRQDDPECVRIMNSVEVQFNYPGATRAMDLASDAARARQAAEAHSTSVQITRDEVRNSRLPQLRQQVEAKRQELEQHRQEHQAKLEKYRSGAFVEMLSKLRGT